MADGPLPSPGPTPTAEVLPLEGEHFRFECRPGLSCFGDCCSDLTLLLMPYDALRLRRRLDLDSASFLDLHTETLRDPETGVPRVLLRMGDDAGRRCPFLVDEGCQVYDDRPSACRMFPLGRAATASGGAALGPARLAGHDDGVRERFFMVKEQVCAGWDEDHEWSVDGWLDNQGLRDYVEQNDQWLSIFTRLPKLAGDPHAEAKFSMFRTAAYDLDRLCELVTGPAFSNRFDLPEAELDALRTDDDALLAFAIRWLRFSLYGDPTLKPGM